MDSSLRIALKRISTRETFIPPPVLPAQAPIIISNSRIVFDNCGHMLKSVVANPVVVMIVPTWKKECRRVSPNVA